MFRHLNEFMETSRKIILLMEEEIKERDGLGCLFFPSSRNKLQMDAKKLLEVNYQK